MNTNLFTGRIQNNIKMSKLKMEWTQRQKNPNMPKEDEEINPIIKHIKETAEQERYSNKVTQIDSKLKSGAVLTQDEMRWLKENEPEMYQDAIKIENERKAYKEKLKRCRTKKDVEKLNSECMQGFFNEAQTISRSQLPKAKKLELLDKVSKRMMAVLDEHNKYLLSDEYARLPDDENEEKHKYSKDKKDDLKYENTINIDDIKKLGEEMNNEETKLDYVSQKNDIDNEYESNIDINIDIDSNFNSDTDISLTYSPNGNLLSQKLPQSSNFSTKI